MYRLYNIWLPVVATKISIAKVTLTISVLFSVAINEDIMQKIRCSYVAIYATHPLVLCQWCSHQTVVLLIGVLLYLFEQPSHPLQLFSTILL